MLSKSKTRATAALALVVLTAGCSRVLPWQNEPVGNEVNIAFVLRSNLVELQGLRVGNVPGRFVFGSAAARTVLDPRFAARATPRSAQALQISAKQTVRIQPVAMNLAGVADGIIGTEAFRRYAVSIDYRSGLVTIQKEGIHPGLMRVFRFDGEPMINVGVDGREVSAIVDTTSPDTLVLPASQAGRRTAHVTIAGTDFGGIDVAYADVARPRIGNRLLSRFLVTIDYRLGWVGLWRDPRIPLRDNEPQAGGDPDAVSGRAVPVRGFSTQRTE